MSSRSLLLVDCDPSERDRLTGILNRGDRILEHASGPAQALERLHSAPVDLIVAGCDHNGSDGLGLLRRVRTLNPAAKVILTGDSDPRAVIGAIRAKAYSFFHSPVPETLFLDMVQRALDSGAWQDDIRISSAWPQWIEAEVAGKLDAVERMAQFLRELEGSLSPAVCEDVTVAFRELLLNAVEHGCGSDPSKRVKVILVHTQRSLIIQIRDRGKGFSLNVLPHAAISNPEDCPTRHVEVRAEQGQRPGGFGILMSSKLVDELVYNERGNEVMLVKYLS